MEPQKWEPAINLFRLYSSRDYDSFGCLFDVRNYGNFRPIAAERGLPVDVSEEVRQAAAPGRGISGHTWITWEEIKQIDWEEKSLHVDKRVHEYRRDEEGKLYYYTKALYDKEFNDRVGYDKCIDEQEQEWDLGDVVYRREYMRREDVKGSWETVFYVMEALAAIFDDNNVRLVVWFDA